MTFFERLFRRFVLVEEVRRRLRRGFKVAPRRKSAVAQVGRSRGAGGGPEGSCSRSAASSSADPWTRRRGRRGEHRELAPRPRAGARRGQPRIGFRALAARLLRERAARPRPEARAVDARAEAHDGHATPARPRTAGERARRARRRAASAATTFASDGALTGDAANRTAFVLRRAPRDRERLVHAERARRTDRARRKPPRASSLLSASPLERRSSRPSAGRARSRRAAVVRAERRGPSRRVDARPPRIHDGARGNAHRLRRPRRARAARRDGRAKTDARESTARTPRSATRRRAQSSARRHARRWRVRPTRRHDHGKITTEFLRVVAAVDVAPRRGAARHCLVSGVAHSRALTSPLRHSGAPPINHASRRPSLASKRFSRAP